MAGIDAWRTDQPVLLFANPTAQSGRARDAIRQAEDMLGVAGVPHRFVATEPNRGTVELVRRTIDDDGVRVVIAAASGRIGVSTTVLTEATGASAPMISFGKCLAETIWPAARMAARSITLRNSLMLPGQRYDSSKGATAGSMPEQAIPATVTVFSRKCRARGMMSSWRSRNAGMSMAPTFRR